MGRLVTAEQPDVVVVHKQRKKVFVIDVAMQSDSKIRKKGDTEEGLTEELERMSKVKVTVVPVEIRAVGAVTHKLGKWLQQVPQTTPEKCAVLPASFSRYRYSTCTFPWLKIYGILLV